MDNALVIVLSVKREVAHRWRVAWVVNAYTDPGYTCTGVSEQAVKHESKKPLPYVVVSHWPLQPLSPTVPTTVSHSYTSQLHPTAVPQCCTALLPPTAAPHCYPHCCPQLLSPPLLFPQLSPTAALKSVTQDTVTQASHAALQHRSDLGPDNLLFWGCPVHGRMVSPSSLGAIAFCQLWQWRTSPNTAECSQEGNITFSWDLLYSSVSFLRSEDKTVLTLWAMAGS